MCICRFCYHILTVVMASFSVHLLDLAAVIKFFTKVVLLELIQ
jgi:hypothetical protein